VIVKKCFKDQIQISFLLGYQFILKGIPVTQNVILLSRKILGKMKIYTGSSKNEKTNINHRRHSTCIIKYIVQRRFSKINIRL
jgi:hypothetical protein